MITIEDAEKFIDRNENMFVYLRGQPEGKSIKLSQKDSMCFDNDFIKCLEDKLVILDNSATESFYHGHENSIKVYK